MFQNYLKNYFKIKVYYLYSQKIFASYITIHFIQIKFTCNSNYLWKVSSLFCFVLSCWDFLNQNVACNAIENLTTSRGTLTWVENFWSYDTKVILFIEPFS
jgi:hypothetical protein